MLKEWHNGRFYSNILSSIHIFTSSLFISSHYLGVQYWYTCQILKWDEHSMKVWIISVPASCQGNMSILALNLVGWRLCEIRCPGTQLHWCASPSAWVTKHRRRSARHFVTLQWHHNERDGVSNDLRHDCLLNRLFKRRSKKISKLRVIGLCEGNSPVTGEFPTQRAVRRKCFHLVTSSWVCHRCRSTLHIEHPYPTHRGLFSNTISANQRRLYICNGFSYWQTPCSVIENGLRSC